MSAALNTAHRGYTGLEWIPVGLGLLTLYVPTFYGLTQTLWERDEFAHAPIILAVILWLIWDKRHVLLTAAARTAPVSGFLSLGFGLLLYILGRSQEIAAFEVGALIAILAGVLLAMRGWTALRIMWFVLLFVVYLVPIPGFLVDALTLPLKQLVSGIAEQVLYTAGYPIARDGIVLVIGKYQLLVADACSGLNSMFSLSAIGLLYLYLMRHSSWLHNGLMLASLLPIAFCANAVRVIVLALITYHFGDEAGQGFLHSFSGVMLFLIALICIAALDAILARIINTRRQAG